MTEAEFHVHDASVVDLFCGAGGLSFGFKKWGFRIDAGVDTDEACRFPFETNVKGPFVRLDVANLDASELEELFIPGKTKILIGCAPCQPFSTYNQKNDDPKWRLLEVFGRLISTTKPEIVSMENVPQLMRFKGGEIFDCFIASLAEAGYHTSFDVLFGPDYGLPQRRSRLVLLASKLGPIELPSPTHKTKHRTVRDAIGKLPRLAAGQEDPKDRLHRASRLSEINLKRIKAATPGGTWKDWDDDLVAECHKAETGKGYVAVYGRMRWDEPAPTVTTQFFGFGNGRFGHPEQDRALSLREGAILQGFPKSYEFVPAFQRVQMKHVGQMIGNAVPVTLAEAIAETVDLHLRKYCHA